MASHKLLQMQMQVRENAAELKDYLKDLETWEADIKKKDKTFSSMKPKHNDKTLPAVRRGNKPKKKLKSDEPPAELPKRIKSYDFKAWDKLDVDEMLHKMDNEEEKMEKIETEEDRQILEENMKKLSLKEKEKGNEHFKAARYQKSVECYTKGMEYDSSNPVLPANRAMAYLKMEKYLETEADCTLSLSLDPVYVKAYLRRGAARRALGKVESAIRDFNDVLKLEPDNKQAKAEMEIIRKQDGKPSVKSDNKASREKLPKPNSRIVHPIKKQLHQQSKKPLRRILVEEVGHDIDIRMNGDEDSSDQYHASPHQNEIGIKEEPSFNSVDDDKPPTLKEEKRAVKEKDNAVSQDQKFSVSSPSNKGPPPLPQPPTTCLQLQADVRRLRSHPETLFKYIKQLPSSTIPTLLKDQLDAELISSIVHSFKDNVQGNEEYITDFLQNLSLAKRFEMVIMFLSSKERNGIRDLFDRLQAFSDFNSENFQSLHKLYGL